MNPWLMGLLAAAVSALAGATASSWWSPEADGRAASGALTSEPDAAPAQSGATASSTTTDTRPPADEVVHPLAALDDDEIGALVQRDPAALGSVSLGAPNRGILFNAVEFPDSPLWKRADPTHSWGTAESVKFVEFAITRVNEQFDNTPLVYVGDFSARRGGRLRPHKSHQSGRDVDIGYYHLGEAVWYQRATAHNLDRARTWVLLKALITQTPVEYVFMDKRIQSWLEEYALAHGEDPQWLSQVFGGASKEGDPIVRHRSGHATHLHVRFENPTAELTGRRSYAWLAQAGLLPGHKQRKRRRPAPLPYATVTRAPATE
jgi:murein endopeptidase